MMGEEEDEYLVKSGRCDAGLDLVWGGTRACMWANMVCHTFRWGEAKVQSRD